MKRNHALLAITAILAAELFVLVLLKKDRLAKPIQPIVVVAPTIPLPVFKTPVANITTVNPGHLSYTDINKQLKKWEREAQDLVDIGTYGSSSEGKNLTYIKLTNELDKTPKPKILITACIHGNEPWSTSIIMNYIGLLLSQYDKNSLLNKEEIYFIPVISPDSFPNSREVDGVDPNRDWENRRSPVVRYLQEFHLKQKFIAVISGHTSGRMYLIPWGEKRELCSDNDSYQSLIGQMSQMSNYRLLRACEIYGRPIFGGELDWFYKNGAFTVVCEFGTHQEIPTLEQTDSECKRTWKAFILFLEKAPTIKLKN